MYKALLAIIIFITSVTLFAEERYIDENAQYNIAAYVLDIGSDEVDLDDQKALASTYNSQTCTKQFYCAQSAKQISPFKTSPISIQPRAPPVEM
ncbi:hypothetical protein [Thalassotalea sediminis]|uniref:hypothetical protein n=1 Tax=Thalassotalea sediminis TaxID=1759089 RepID=UPI0025723281|nr:hypothetical protein [Thalassotalea sediminis]